ncbi:hypothetical protein EYF80_044962 [Liparis tanakae]|uniref:Uncharacterized protein n=1 Tax=Liparis tanakae TaxID=230148 RepID=A0A4Z2FW73_9TELE|nr:hypothetical protein EYF80_044962 [Liparis tanakae]
MKEPRLGSQLKGRAGALNRASPYGRWPVTLLLTQLKQTQTLLGYSKHAHWARSRLQHSWFDGPEAKYMHLGTNLLSDAPSKTHEATDSSVSCIVRQCHLPALDRGALPVLGAGGGPAQTQRGVEVLPVVLAVAAVVRAAGGAEAVGGRPSQDLLSAGPLLLLLLLLLLLMGEARRGDALPRRRNGLGLDVDALAGVDGEVGSLR